jgi:hypothetical protein
MWFSVRRRRLFVVRSRILPSSWKLRTLLVLAHDIQTARTMALALARYSNEWQDVRRADVQAVRHYSGHQTERTPAGVGML